MANILHEKVFEFCEGYRAEHPDFLYWLRERNTQNRLDEGLWFQGNETYTFVGLYDRSGGTNMTRSFGLVFWMENNKIFCNLENVFNEEVDSKVLSLYGQLRDFVGGFEEIHKTKFRKVLSEEDGLAYATSFLDNVKPQIDELINKNDLQHLFITEEDFNKKLKRINQYRSPQKPSNEINYIIVNLTWNSNDWQGPSQDKSGHRWVNAGNIPHESWNFDFDNDRNTPEYVYGYCQFTHPPKVERNENLIIFYSNNQIVGFYGQAEVKDKEVIVNTQESYNLVGARPLCILLKNKISNVKEKGYLEDKKRIGQVGFNYLNKKSTVFSIIKEAITLNPDEAYKLNDLLTWLKLEDDPTKININMEPKHQYSLNQILFGPPGTGKTYHTITEAIKIVDPEYYKLNANDRNKLQDRFNELLIKDWEKTEGQISFCTFHQSFSYEDFVEGIKPLKPEKSDTSIKYDIINGIFKNICRLADANNNAQKLAKENPVSLTQNEFNKAVFYKISLGDSTKEEDKEIYNFCISNDVISIGFDASTDFSGKDESQVNKIISDEKLDSYTSQAINLFKNYLKTGNYIIVSYGNSYIRALGKVIGEYEYKPDAEIRYKHFRKVEWIFKNVEIPVTEFYKKNLSQQTIYKLKSEFIIPSFFVRQDKPADIKLEPKSFVLVIDEINRGNVSSIFGELITLIEPTKRSGKLEALEVVLPYSKVSFSVPSNVHIIGTMNTADRSIESLDTALRRRFSFIEMKSLPDIIRTEGKSKGLIEGIDIVQMLENINERIEKLIDKDHMIGHSYFLEVKNFQDLKLVFKDKVIPLLEEYFYGDFGKIGLVLGDEFVSIKNENSTYFTFAKFKAYDGDVVADLKSRKVYQFSEPNVWTISSFQKIYDLTKE